jgi:hypothetical protein
VVDNGAKVIVAGSADTGGESWSLCSPTLPPSPPHPLLAAVNDVEDGREDAADRGVEDSHDAEV